MRSIPEWNEYLEELVVEWHDGPDDGTPLHEYLGMTWDECKAWTEESRRIPARWLE